ncbi:MAG: hypothetical protein HXY46_08685 [Syntrophaceae bacterium]|nr:hypothetical protein [Syntrophaceae bacterium]
MSKGAIFLLACAVFFLACSTGARPPFLPPPAPSEPASLSEIAVLNEEEIVPTEEAVIIPVVEERKDEGIAVERESKEPVTRDSPTEVQKSEVTDIPASIPAAAPLTPEKAVPRPDLTVTDLSFDPKKRLTVTLANVGDGPLPLESWILKIFVDGQIKGSYPLSGISDQSLLQPKESIRFVTPLSFRGRHEVEARVVTGEEMKEQNEENNYLRRILEGAPEGPDIVVQDLDLTEDLDLAIILSNVGEIELPSGVTFRVQILVNGIKVSEFEHFTSEVLKAHSGNRYTIDPPYRVRISGIARVRVSVLPKVASSDVRLENNSLQRTFIIFPFQVPPQASEEFSFSVFSPGHKKEEGETERIKAEARWQGTGVSLLISFRGPEDRRAFVALSEESPLKVEVPIHSGEIGKEGLWTVSVVNLIERRIEGHLIVQHP